ncbi:hypothetical protein EHI46_12550 [Rhizobium leguminosarum]|nr:hypothetical protein EHI46_12550 [Rhizobium leguminosarum]
MGCRHNGQVCAPTSPASAMMSRSTRLLSFPRRTNGRRCSRGRDLLHPAHHPLLWSPLGAVAATVAVALGLVTLANTYSRNSRRLSSRQTARTGVRERLEGTRH